VVFRKSPLAPDLFLSATAKHVIFRIMARKWSNENLPGALHFVTANIVDRTPIFRQSESCLAFMTVLSDQRPKWPFKLVAYVLMPDHVHLIVNPPDGRIRELVGALKSLSARALIASASALSFTKASQESKKLVRQVWQESFKAMPLWSPRMIWQKINYVHNNPLKARIVTSAKDYAWSSFRAFYFESGEPLSVDKDWWWEDDVKKLSAAVAARGSDGKYNRS
jgi:putative transposase